MSDSVLDLPAPPLQPDGQRGYDLRGLLQTAGFIDTPATGTGPRTVVRQIETTPVDITGRPQLEAVGYTDGVQQTLLIRHLDHRPLTLAWVCAGAVGGDGDLLAIRQRTLLIASAADGDRADQLGAVGGGVPVRLVPDLTPWGVATATAHVVDAGRRELERDVVMNLAVPPNRWLVVDGPIRGYDRDNIVGVIKTVDTQYLCDESVIPDEAGWRSPAFELPVTSTAERAVTSAYLRLHDAPGAMPWEHGLVRIEAPDVTTLDAACAMALRQRQSPGGGDNRWATHLQGVARTEHVLRAFSCYVFDF